MPEKWLIQVSAAMSKAARAAAKKAGLSLSDWVRQMVASNIGDESLAEVPRVGAPKRKKAAKKSPKKKPA